MFYDFFVGVVMQFLSGVGSSVGAVRARVADKIDDWRFSVAPS